MDWLEMILLKYVFPSAWILFLGGIGGAIFWILFRLWWRRPDDRFSEEVEENLEQYRRTSGIKK